MLNEGAFEFDPVEALEKKIKLKWAKEQKNFYYYYFIIESKCFLWIKYIRFKNFQEPDHFWLNSVSIITNY